MTHATAPAPVSDYSCVPFDTAEEAWFWFIQAHTARAEGARIVSGAGSSVRPCEPLDILKILERLWRQRILLRDHVLVLRHYGRRLIAPDPHRTTEAKAATLWRQAMDRLEPIFVRRGIIMPPKGFWGQEERATA